MWNTDNNENMIADRMNTIEAQYHLLTMIIRHDLKNSINIVKIIVLMVLLVLLQSTKSTATGRNNRLANDHEYARIVNKYGFITRVHERLFQMNADNAFKVSSSFAIA